MAAVSPAFATEGIADFASLETTRSDTAARAFTPTAVKETLEYYDVTGTSEQELRERLRQKGFQASDGRIYDAVTSWEISWNYEHRRSAQSCAADAFTVNADVRIRYPRWDRDHGAPRGLVEKWDRYFMNLVLHEEGHRNIAVQAADDLSKAIAELPPAPSCDDLDREILALGEKFMKRLSVDERAYDNKTGHGALQGAFLQ